MVRRYAPLIAVAITVLFAARAVVSDWRLALSYGTAWDLDIYIRAIARMDAGVSIYDWTNDFGMGFTYPPIAALLLAPLTWVSQAVVTRIWLAASIGAAVLLVALLRWLSGPMPRSAWTVAVLAGSVGAFLGTSAVQDNLISGQINLFLALLIVLDVGRVLPRPARGVLVGLAAAIKLTPLIVIAWYVLSRQWREALNATGVFIVAALVGLILLPEDARDFWGSAVHDTNRVGPLDLPGNASLMGTLAKAGVTTPALTMIWLGLGGLIVLAAFLQAERSRRMGDNAAAAIILGAAAVVASPISWPAHQIWLPLAGLLLAWRRGRWALAMGLALIAFCYFHIPLSRLWDGRGLVELVMDDVDFFLFSLICLLGLGARRATVAGEREPTRVRAEVG